MAGCGGSSSEGSSDATAEKTETTAEQTTDETTEVAETDDPLAAYTAAGYLDASGYITARAVVDLDGAALSELAEASGYKWNEDGWELKPMKVRARLSPSKGLTSEEMEGTTIIDTDKFDFTEDEVKGFAAGSAGTSLRWFIEHAWAEYEDAAQVLADQNVDVIDQCEVESNYYGTVIWAVVEGKGGRLLLQARHYDSNNSGTVEVYTPEYLVTSSNGVASSFDTYCEGLDNAHTIDEVWQIIAGRALGA